MRERERERESRYCVVCMYVCESSGVITCNLVLSV